MSRTRIRGFASGPRLGRAKPNWREASARAVGRPCFTATDPKPIPCQAQGPKIHPTPRAPAWNAPFEGIEAAGSVDKGWSLVRGCLVHLLAGARRGAGAIAEGRRRG